jgi:hypothetical protein
VLFSSTKSEERIQQTLYSCREQKLFSCFRWWIRRTLLQCCKSSPIIDWSKRIVVKCVLQYLRTTNRTEELFPRLIYVISRLLILLVLSYMTDMQSGFVITFLHYHTWLIRNTALWWHFLLHRLYWLIVCVAKTRNTALFTFFWRRPRVPWKHTSNSAGRFVG